MKLTPGQLYLLQWMANNNPGGVSRIWHKPHDAPTDTGMPGLLGMLRRGLVTESANGIFYITDAGRKVAISFVMCPACSKPIRNTRRLPLHKCEHGVVCSPASVDPDTHLLIGQDQEGRWWIPGIGRRSRTCEKCNHVTMLQRRMLIGERGADAGKSE